MEGVLVPLGFFSLVGIGLWFDTMKMRRRLQVQLELGAKSLEKIGNAQELTTFLESDAGRQFLNVLAGIGTPSGRGFLFTLQAGIVFMVLGLAFVVIAATEMDRDFTIPATVCFFLGAGLSLSAMVARRLSKTWSRREPALDVFGHHPYRDEGAA